MGKFYVKGHSDGHNKTFMLRGTLMGIFLMCSLMCIFYVKGQSDGHNKMCPSVCLLKKYAHQCAH